MSGDVAGSVVRNNAVVDSNQRCVVVHQTHKVRVENNVAYNSFGHCFILEDGVDGIEAIVAASGSAISTFGFWMKMATKSRTCSMPVVSRAINGPRYSIRAKVFLHAMLRSSLPLVSLLV